MIATERKIVSPVYPINIKAFGAKGDGVTDDTKAIKAAVKATPDYDGASIGGTGVAIYFPPGVYMISETIEINNNCWLYGAGRDGTTGIRLADNSDCDMFHIGRKGVADEPVTPTIKGIVFSMNRHRQAAGCANIRFFNMIRHGIFYDLFFRQSTESNVIFEVEDGFSTMNRNNYFTHCSFEYSPDSAVLARHSYNLNFNLCYFGFGTSGDYIGLDIRMSSVNLKILNNWFLTNIYRRNIEIIGTQQVNISGNTFRASGDSVAGTSILKLRGNMNNVIISNNNLEVNSPYENGYELERAANVLCHDNILKGKDIGGTYIPAYTGDPFTSTEDFADQDIYNNLTEDGFVANYPAT